MLLRSCASSGVLRLPSAPRPLATGTSFQLHSCSALSPCRALSRGPSRIVSAGMSTTPTPVPSRAERRRQSRQQTKGGPNTQPAEALQPAKESTDEPPARSMRMSLAVLKDLAKQHGMAFGGYYAGAWTFSLGTVRPAQPHVALAMPRTRCTCLLSIITCTPSAHHSPSPP